MTSQALPVALDAMGGDGAPEVTVRGAIEAVRVDGISTVLVGDEEKLKQLLQQLGAKDLLKSELLSIVNANEVVSMEDKPSAVVRQKKYSSMRIACNLVKDEKALGVISAGNSGAMMATALFVLGRIKGVLRPAIATVIPSVRDNVLVIDAGANNECTPEYLTQFALMGHVYMKNIYSLKNPKIALLANGEEESKCNELTRLSLKLIRKTNLNCTGYIEGRDILAGKADVIVCDGFSGNIFLKTAEGTAMFLMHLIKQAYLNGGFWGKMGALLSKKVFKSLKRKVDHREFGAAPLLGLKAPSFIAHGSADAYTIRRAIGRVKEQSEYHMPNEIAAALLA